MTLICTATQQGLEEVDDTFTITVTKVDKHHHHASRG